jgi:group II intron reverse transcriptase/maturase
MNEHGQSDDKVVPKKPANKAEKSAAERVEGSASTEGNEKQGNTRQTQDWESVNNKLQLIREKAKADKEMQFTTLLHHVYSTETLRAAYFSLKRDAGAGVDGETWQSYGETLDENLRELSDRLKRGGYRPKPVRRVYIPKPDGTKRPIGITAMEDKIVQRALVEVMNAIYEVDFKGFSYGFRPGRSQHKALDALYVAITQKKVNWIIDADIRNFFGAISFENLIKFVERRIADKRVIRLIYKWLGAGVFEDGEVDYEDEGTPQGASISPLLANIYLHYVYDQWIQEWRKERAKGEVIVVRFADDTIVGLERQSDAELFLKELTDRLQQFGLELHPEKTRLIEFGRFAAERRQNRGEGKPETFTFLGFTHICGKSKDGCFQLKRKTIGKKMRAKLDSVKMDLRKRMHKSVKETGEWLRKVLQGHYQYYGIPGNYQAMSNFRKEITRAWARVLRHRSQRAVISWQKMEQLSELWLPTPQLHHPYPNIRFPRQYQGKSRVR